MTFNRNFNSTGQTTLPECVANIEGRFLYTPNTFNIYKEWARKIDKQRNWPDVVIKLYNINYDLLILQQAELSKQLKLQFFLNFDWFLNFLVIRPTSSYVHNVIKKILGTYDGIVYIRKTSV